MLWLVTSIYLAWAAQAYGFIPAPGGVAVWVVLWAPFELAGWSRQGVVLGSLLALLLLVLAP